MEGITFPSTGHSALAPIENDTTTKRIEAQPKLINSIDQLCTTPHAKPQTPTLKP